ncbi:MAG: 50S ribosomal protein L44e [Nanoarchaeota archaeon]|nr:50S ribosomal protein L44e [Nanoarchaeota archaeon]MBU1322414.1 50S ribosomal protein L44e [Nanoarchaeota archaeon]MBU1598163.1 50S ribosomal protein L44e [Nanoarchaeota archaeon]MBU2441430.1 50S ribosomal protein L44e [Nanoarchaeota archaeon]
MKVKKAVKRHCPHCKKHTEHKVSLAKKKGRNAAHPLSRGSKKRVRQRGQRRGAGNLGKYSKPTKPKMSGKKLSKKTDFRYTCKQCSKTFVQAKGIRAKKIELV